MVIFKRNGIIYWSWCGLGIFCLILSGLVAWIASPQESGIWQLGFLSIFLVVLCIFLCWNGDYRSWYVVDNNVNHRVVVSKKGG
jgi:hypothetical protein